MCEIYGMHDDKKYAWNNDFSISDVSCLCIIVSGVSQTFIMLIITQPKLNKIAHIWL